MAESRIAAPPGARSGRVVTFYSYKGGIGRTMALANVAWILAANGRRVLVADWDLESPGLHRFFHPFLDESTVRYASGIIDLIRKYKSDALKAEDLERSRRLIPERAKVLPHALSLNWDFPDGGGLDFLSAGRQNLDYAATLASMDWDDFYEKLNGGEFLDAVRADMKRHYDYVLIDSRTGLSDIAGICTSQLPDVLVDCFTFSTQCMEGAAEVARGIEERHKDRQIRVLPVPMRVDSAEQERADAGRAVAVQLFAGLPAGMSEAQRREYWAAVEVPYRAFYAYEETLAIFGDSPGSPTSLLASFERITARISDGAVTALPPMDERVRNRIKLLFARRAPVAHDETVATFGPEGQAGRASTVRLPGTDPVINTAPVRNARFTGRENDLRLLSDMLTDPTDARPVAILGLGGIGKTQVAIEYAHRSRTEYDLIWWIECGQPQFIDASLADLGTRIGHDLDLGVPATTGAAIDAAKAARLVLRLLEQGKTGLRWLLVFDNADDIGRVEQYLPSGGGKVIVTSRSRDWGYSARACYIEVFRRDESIAHLGKRVPSIGQQEASEVAELLGDLPLAVATAGAWLAESGMPVADFKRELERPAPHPLSFTMLADYPQSVSHTWDLSLSLLRQRSAAAARLFDLCSVMAPSIGLELIHSTAMAKVLEPYDPELAEPMVIGRLVKEIDRTALIKIDGNSGQILIHSLVQAVVRDRMSPEQALSARSDVHHVLAASRPSRGVDNPETWGRFRLIWPHLDPSQTMKSLDEQVRQLSIDRVRYLWHRRDLENGRLTASRIDSCWEEMLGAPPAPGLSESIRMQLLQLRFNLANILRDQASFAEARALDESVLAEQRELLGARHPHTLMTAGSLAADLRAVGDYRAALEMDQVTYPAWTESYGEGHVRALAAANNLAVSYRLAGDFVKALRLDEETLQRRRETLGPRHPQTLLSASNVVRDLLEAGEYNEAVARTGVLRQEAEQALGADSVTGLSAEMLLGIALRGAGQPREAEPHFHSAYEGLSRQSGGPTSSASLACRLGHAVNLLAIDRAAEAEAEIRQVLTVYEERLGPRHPHTLVCMIDLACALRLQERADLASQLARPAEHSLREVLGDRHPYTLAARSVLAVLLADQGELSEAEEAETQVAEVLTATLGPAHPDTLRSRANLLLTRKQLGVAGAEDELNETLIELAGALGPYHPQIEMLRSQGRLIHTLDPQPF